MIRKKSKVVLTERDRELLHFLFESRGSTLSDIHNRFFHSRHPKNVANRLRKLRDAKFIGMDTSMDLPSRYFYFIQSRGLKKCYPKAKTLKGLRLKSPDLRHDFLLTQIKDILQKSQIIHDYYTENMMFLESFQWQIGGIFKHDRSFRPDALFITVDDDGPIYNAVELEINQKGSKNYREKIQKYYFNRKISYVLMISGSRTIEKKIMEEEKSLHLTGNTKFFYGNLESLLEQKLPFTFKSCNGAKSGRNWPPIPAVTGHPFRP